MFHYIHSDSGITQLRQLQKDIKNHCEIDVKELPNIPLDLSQLKSPRALGV